MRSIGVLAALPLRHRWSLPQQRRPSLSESRRQGDRALRRRRPGRDIYARAIGQQLSDALRQPFTIENKPGAGAVIGTVEVARATPDGYTLLMMSNTHTGQRDADPEQGL